MASECCCWERAGPREAARRAGISVSGIKIACFVICSTLAAVAGILFASKDNSVSPSTGGSTTLLFAVGAAVIGGTSLFGGRGKIRDAIIFPVSPPAVTKKRPPSSG